MNLVYFFCNIQQFSQAIPELAKIDVRVYKECASVLRQCTPPPVQFGEHSNIYSWIKTNNIG